MTDLPVSDNPSTPVEEFTHYMLGLKSFLVAEDTDLIGTTIDVVRDGASLAIFGTLEAGYQRARRLTNDLIYFFSPDEVYLAVDVWTPFHWPEADQIAMQASSLSICEYADTHNLAVGEAVYILGASKNRTHQTYYPYTTSPFGWLDPLHLDDNPIPNVIQRSLTELGDKRKEVYEQLREGGKGHDEVQHALDRVGMHMLSSRHEMLQISCATNSPIHDAAKEIAIEVTPSFTFHPEQN